MKEGDTIGISFNKKKEEIIMKVLHQDGSAEDKVDDVED
jgi:hypothetical protein